MSKVNIILKLNGAVEAVAGVKTLALSFPENSTYQDVVKELGKRYPSLVGWLIAQDGCTFLSSNLFLVNGEEYVFPGMENERIRDGDQLILMSPITGG